MSLLGLVHQASVILPLEAKSAPTASFEAKHRLLTRSADREGSGLAVIFLVT